MRSIDFYARKPGEAPFPTDVYKSSDLNEDGHEILWTVNEFEPQFNRRKENLKKIWCFYVDTDNISEDEMRNIFKKTLEPSYVVKTKRGFHIYYDIDTPIDCSSDPVGKSDWFRDWLVTRMLKVFKADPQACDSCRLLRPAFYRYWKDGIGDFHTDLIVDNQPKKYSLETLEYFFPKEIIRNNSEIYEKKINKNNDSKKFWDRANNIDCKEALERLSGSHYVFGESYKIARQRDGTYRVHCNGKPSNVWIDKNGLIGSTDRAGPAIPNWLNWYWNDWKKVAEILKEFFGIEEL